MADGKILNAIIKKCDFLYNGEILSKEGIIEKYLDFVARQFNPSEKTIGFAFHTGSLCFDVVSVAALLIGCLAYEFSSNDEILSELENGDMVLYDGERYRWIGIKNGIPYSKDKDKRYIILQQDGKGKNGNTDTYIPYESGKHKVKPYHGTSMVTDGRGIRNIKNNRNDFISTVLGISTVDVPSSFDFSTVVIADKNEFVETIKRLKIRYKDNKYVEVTDVVPVSYFTSNGEEFQIGSNASKAEAVIKIVSKVSMARELVLDKTRNKVMGIMVCNKEILNTDSVELAEMNDLLRRKSLRFAVINSIYDYNATEKLMNQYDTAEFFACTKEMLLSIDTHIIESNKYTRELNRQVHNIISCNIKKEKIDCIWNWEKYRSIKERLYILKQSDRQWENKDNFIVSALSLINLFSTSFFSMKQMEMAISEGKINISIVSPKERITELKKSIDGINGTEKYTSIVDELEEMYNKLEDESPKWKVLLNLLNKNRGKKIVVVVPKAYYADLFYYIGKKEFENVDCITANRFDKDGSYDLIISTGDIVGKRFDAIQCFSARQIVLLLYDFEETTFSFRRKKSAKQNQKLNAKMFGTDFAKDIEVIDDNSDHYVNEQTIEQFNDLNEFADSLNRLDMRYLNAGSANSGDSSNYTEVKYVGVFVTGEQILFSKNYAAVVIENGEGSVIEKNPEKLLPGDVLVFTKKGDYTRNIVDQIFEQLLHSGKLNTEVWNAADKVTYWKWVLREYKDLNRLTYRSLAKILREHGCSIQEVSVRQWLVEDSHIVGPRDANMFRVIGEVTQDEMILNDPEGYFDACRLVRHYRRGILGLIAYAINGKLGNKEAIKDEEFEVVYENIEQLSETIELENIYELENVAVVNNGMVNRPISGSEVMM